LVLGSWFLVETKHEAQSTKHKAMPEPCGFFEAIAELKDLVDLNVELAAQTSLFQNSPVGRSEACLSPAMGKSTFSTTTSIRRHWRKLSAATHGI